MMMNILHDMEQHTGDPPYNVQQIWQRLNEYFDIEELVCNSESQSKIIA
jgi:hypothetical protein